jgi:serine phosphatase RsbU (regulator of sigma subunit)
MHLIYRSATGNIESAPLKGLPLGSFADLNYSKINVKLNKDDVVALMSDGLPELFNSKCEMLGYEQVTTLFSEASQKIT